MCGFIFQKNHTEIINFSKFKYYLDEIKWRGPDVQKVVILNNGKVAMGHCRLSILDLHSRSDQPMVSACGQFYILLNGEIYNHKDVRAKLDLVCNTESDTETILNGYVKLGNKVFSLLDGMFSVLIFDVINDSWVAARDAFGIKPLFVSEKNNQVVLSSEAAVIARMIDAKSSQEAISEWEVIRRPLPGYSFFEDVREIRPGTILNSNGTVEEYWQWVPSEENFEQAKFEELLDESIKAHCLSDVENVSLLSGGLDSALITKLSSVNTCYTVGMPSNNEFEGAIETASIIHKKLITVKLTENDLKENWRYLIKLRGEPLSLPNEGLIYHVCQSMPKNEKVVLTGEGADELLFGYDEIFRWCLEQTELDAVKFLLKYGYSDEVKSQRLIDFVNELKNGKTPIEFLEDFFYQVHLPGLLRRMDFSSMAASKEARVPFVCKKLISYLYRQSAEIKINNYESKIPIRKLAKRLGLEGALTRKKLGFSATIDLTRSKQQDYEEFRKFVMDVLKW